MFLDTDRRIHELARVRHDALWDDAVESIAESAAAEWVIADAIGLDSTRLVTTWIRR